MIATVCRFYGWTFRSVLNMQVRQFFLMLRTAERVRALELSEQCDIAILPMMSNSKYYEERKEHYRLRYFPDLKRQILDEVSRSVQKPLAGEEARANVFAFFAAVKGEVPH